MINMIKALFRKSKISKPSKAFSLIELSIVVLIIGILIAGVTQGSRLVKQSRVSTAQNQTQTSPVNSIPNLVGWWETTSANSFKDIEADDGLQPTIWYDISSQSINKNNATPGATVAGSATYRATAINGLPALVFAGTSLNQSFALADPTIINSSDYTIFVVENHSTTSIAKNYFLCGSATVVGAPYNNLVLGYSTVASNNVVWSYLTTAASATNYASQGTITQPATNIETIHSYVHKISNGASAKKYFMNGTQQTLTTNDANSLASWAGASIGCSLAVSPGGAFTGAIGEVIIYNRALSTEERKSVEGYLGKKWSVTVS
jgi:prepilin-type N-terminal cleavage/methylation domain-containing protein